MYPLFLLPGNVSEKSDKSKVKNNNKKAHDRKSEVYVRTFLIRSHVLF